MGQIREGIIPIGFSDELLWPFMQNISNKVTESLNKETQDLEKIDKKLYDETKELEELEIKKIQLQKSIQENTAKKLELNQKIQTSVDFIELIGKKDDFFETIIQQESKIVMKIENDFKEMDEDINLQFIFNCYGFSSPFIKAFGNISFEQFLDDDPIALCNERNIHKPDDLLDLCYVHMMLLNNILPNKKHIDKCPVCVCDSPRELLHVINEGDRNFDEIDLNFLESCNLNGRRIISISYSNLQTIFDDLPNKTNRQFTQAQNLLKRLHARAN